MVEHTPGPWEMRYDNHGNGGFDEWYEVGPEDTAKYASVARVYLWENTGQANARLIAAAPETAAERDRLKEINADLLAALESLLTAKGPALVFARERARAAIAKAGDYPLCKPKSDSHI